MCRHAAKAKEIEPIARSARINEVAARLELFEALKSYALIFFLDEEEKKPTVTLVRVGAGFDWDGLLERAQRELESDLAT